jgi:hypothetical protein
MTQRGGSFADTPIRHFAEKPSPTHVEVLIACNSQLDFINYRASGIGSLTLTK